MKTKVLTTAAVSVLAACASVSRNTETPPRDWMADSTSAHCEALSGTYAAAGIPAPENSQQPTQSGWAPVGSLASLIEPELELPAISSVRIRIDSAGQPVFDLQGAGEARQLNSLAWACSGASLVSRLPLDASRGAYSGAREEQLQVQLWKSADGSLVAEETLESVERHLRRSSLVRRPLARFYFRFPAEARRA